MLNEILKHLKNYFIVKDGLKKGGYKIEEGSITLPFLKNEQYFKIDGSIFNDGVYQYPPQNLIDEEFNGCISVMAIPRDFLELVEEMETWNSKSENQTTGYTSESFGGYSYSKATNKDGVAATWQDIFKTRLNAWRKL